MDMLTARGVSICASQLALDEVEFDRNQDGWYHVGKNSHPEGWVQRLAEENNIINTDSTVVIESAKPVILVHSLHERSGFGRDVIFQKTILTDNNSIINEWVIRRLMQQFDETLILDKETYTRG
ncbi:hypothetical protein BV898_16147 [Hypsibius exemplaris]|uniref:Uncharacterized protein n=1 Tax=Hypsibius exemplaris TaxID=2072580 RepID=A0A9X6NER2_HYPEX|nr:hypothetical protein BV898_16147 [Hypsibius exemplaris]